eukprot:COSAG06_NODE_61050_length_269_cov_0.576471_1_plen_35_part_10
MQGDGVGPVAPTTSVAVDSFHVPCSTAGLVFFLLN